jgi:uncharacterized membrane protein YfcA
MNRKLIGAVIIIIGLVLFLDEIWMLFPFIGWPGWLIGDWIWLHMPPFHHWMFGVVLIIVGLYLIKSSTSK